MVQANLFESKFERTLRVLRDRQAQAIDDMRQAVKEGHKRIVIQAPCGFGKTILAAHLIASALDKGRRPLFTCPAISLIDQTYKSFQFEGIHDIGVMQAQHECTDRMARVQLASVQTLVKRDLPEVDFMILDEIHMRFHALNELLDGPWKDKIAIGMSATPWAKGMGLRWTKLIIPATIPQLIDEGFLSPTDLYIPEQIAERGNIEIKEGEFTEASASKEMRQGRIVGNVVETWKKLGPGEKTFMFCVNREHAKEQMGAFIDSGIPFGYIDANTDRPDRKVVFDKMRGGEIAGIASVGCLIAGVDEDVRCLIDIAPTTSEMRLVQKWGRGIRTAPGKESLIGLDHAGNNSAEGLGLFWEIYHDHLDTHKKTDKAQAYESETRPPKPKRCHVCHVLIPKGHAVCLKCGTPIPAMSNVDHIDGELRLYGKPKKVVAEKPVVIPKVKVSDEQAFYSGLLDFARRRGFKDGWAKHKYHEKFGGWPDRLNDVQMTPRKAVKEFIRESGKKYREQKKDEQAKEVAA
jgi:superfamily II DNA or RNA helicase